MKLHCPICGPNTVVSGKTCRKCKTTWDNPSDFYLLGYHTYYRAALSFLTKKPPTMPNLSDGIEMLHLAFRFKQELEKL